MIFVYIILCSDLFLLHVHSANTKKVRENVSKFDKESIIAFTLVCFAHGSTVVGSVDGSTLVGSIDGFTGNVVVETVGRSI